MKRRGPRKWSIKDLPHAVKQSNCMTECLQLLGIGETGGNFKTVKEYIKELKISTEHWTPMELRVSSLASHRKYYTDEEVFSNPAIAGIKAVKRRLWKIRKPNCCELCGQGLTWNGNELKLQLDHIDGNRKNNLLENLRWICPNCHSQTDTFAGKNK